MGEQLVEIFQAHPQWAIVISLFLSVVIAVAGILPSVFITAANILFFGFWEGLFMSFLGEAIGAVVAFILYRKGFKKAMTTPLHKYPRIERLIEANGKEAFVLILGLRLLPFVPSGLVTFAGAIGNVSLMTFAIASSLGKVPALFIEAYSVYQVTQFGWQGKLILVIIAGLLIYWVATHKKGKPE
ncbi:TVP38/TMEM64 family protein [Flavisolibacter tropicus]|uniref:TVP38/TMEM64 family membrane protein n=1 Tax=Flavisolibacter tropicus TaxID=1492898 RepID=A0A172TYJ7_9BACT|nr:VTT domain-containing protein [Flavisolibacter tropicus]ANE52062.1 membrane protein [Flavisolibacter tropicus]